MYCEARIKLCLVNKFGALLIKSRVILMEIISSFSLYYYYCVKGRKL